MTPVEEAGESPEEVRVLRLPKAGLTAEVPVGSPEYQAYLDENKRVEDLREEQGGLNAGDLDGLRKAVQRVSAKAREVLKNSRTVGVTSR